MTVGEFGITYRRDALFFVLSKLLELVFQPVNFIVLAGLAGLLLSLTRFAHLGRGIAVAAAIVFAVICFSPLGALLLRPLEDRFPQPVGTLEPTGIVVLGGSIDSDVGAARGQPTLTDAAARLTTGVALALEYPKARLVFTGGSSDVRQQGLDEAQAVHGLWRSLGVPENRMAFEDESRNTYENATLTRALVDPKPGEAWLLVTSAAHMPRSVGVFRKAGWTVVPYPVDYRTYGDWRDVKPNGIALDSLQRINIALHEWIGLIAYRLTNKTGSLFPAP